MKARPQTQESFFWKPTKQERRVKVQYDRLLESVSELIERSFSEDDLAVLSGSALASSLAANIEKIEIMQAQLERIRRAMVNAISKREALGA